MKKIRKSLTKSKRWSKKWETAGERLFVTTTLTNQRKTPGTVDAKETRFGRGKRHWQRHQRDGEIYSGGRKADRRYRQEQTAAGEERQAGQLKRKLQKSQKTLKATEEGGEGQVKGITINDLRRKNEKVCKKAHKTLGSLGLVSESEHSFVDSSSDSSGFSDSRE